MHDFVQLAKKVRELVAQGDLSQAVEILTEGLANHEELDNVLLISARLANLNEGKGNGVIHEEFAFVERNKISKEILEIARRIELLGKADTRIYICYHPEPNSLNLANQLYDKLAQNGYQVFLDVKDIPPGSNWVLKKLSELKECDYFVLFLSREATYSEMILREVSEVSKLKEKVGKPIILPVYINYTIVKTLNKKLYDYLYQIQHLDWQKEADTQGVFGKLLEVISTNNNFPNDAKLPEPDPKMDLPKEESAPTQKPPLPLPTVRLETPIEVARLNSPFYVTRKHEKEFISFINEPGALLRIRGPRQFGKTSLLIRIIAEAKRTQHQVVAIDFSKIMLSPLSHIEGLLFEFSTIIAYEFGIHMKLNELWRELVDSNPKQKVTTFMRKEVLKRLKKSGSPLLIAMDEVDQIFKYPHLSNEFFLMLRDWHEASKTQPIWENLKIAVSHSTEARLAIQDLDASPFNVGHQALIPPFSLDQIDCLVGKHQLKLNHQQIETFKNFWAANLT